MWPEREAPAIVILMVPLDQRGNLESLCVDAAEAKWNLRAKVDLYLEETPARLWGYSKQSKMRMQCILAGTCKTSPDITLAGHWKLEEEFQVPINSSCFDGIVTFLRDFGAAGRRTLVFE